MFKPNHPEVAPLTPTEEAAALRELLREWRSVNINLFRSALHPVQLELRDADGVLGRWRAASRTIEISKRALEQLPWPTLVEVLKHEMAHQFVDEVIGAREETAHGATFRSVCRDRGIDPRAVLPTSTTEGPAASERIEQRVQKLLALAGSSNEHEARSAMSAARRLMLRHNIDAVKSQSADDYTFRHLGRPSGRIGETERQLANLLTEHFFVEAIWIPVFVTRTGKRGRVLEICGTPSNVEIAAYVFDFLGHTAEALWRSHKQERAIPSDAERRRFKAGVMLGFGETLRSASKADCSAGLVYVGDTGLPRFLRSRHPYIRHTYSRGGAPSDAYHEGKSAGRNIVLHRGVTAPGSDRGHALPARSGD